MGFLTVIGDDWRGREMEKLLDQRIDYSLVVTAEDELLPLTANLSVTDMETSVRSSFGF